MKNFKNILVTGANGQLARCLKDASRDYPNYNFFFKTSKELDITNEKEIQTLFTELNFDYCINCAAYTAVDKAEDDKENAFLVNAEGVKFLAKACKSFETVLIHISTDFVFDGTKNSPYTENDITNPINVYGASKLKGEEYIKNILENYFIIRTSWVYSEFGNNFVKTMLKLGKDRNNLSVVDDQIGSPTFAEDLARLILEIIDSNSLEYGIHNFSNDGEISWYEFAQEIFQESKISIELKPLKSSEYPTKAKRPKYSVLSKLKIRNALSTEIPLWKNSLKKCLVSLEQDIANKNS
ncbi:dTDP-4-dehydrorhamnose reductase [Cellulophaga algicola DSM 14237]|uniref:dTDP-4-dehydrorhamnose reductase n=1 Tax=Cellulophaga algicola (strain DSM 14237 / IC166 / ACAM 630) TaxID=688270 RepID=E6XB36_CELAD|nr:dTDP-4-dehydrorhamnose reductase [Cellulophaga algicola]ADV48892.1 dTDP-4-dehydrorhamnose reductase [Cellulophaga algicola DSM 14237]